MFLILLWKDIKVQLMTFRFAAAFLTIMILVLISFWVLGDDYLRRMNSYNIAAETTTQDNLEVYVPSQITPMVHRPPSALSIFAQGENRRLGNSLRIYRWEVPYTATGNLTDNKFMASEPALDLYTIFAVVVSLFGILFGYDAISGEKEDGTLKLKSITGVSRNLIYLSKFVSGAVCLLIPVTFSVLAGLAMLLIVFKIQFAAIELVAIGVMLLSGIIFSALFNGIGVACSSFCHRSSRSLLFALLIWSVSCLLVPSMASNISQVVQPLDSPNKMEVTKKTSLDEARDKEKNVIKDHPKVYDGWFLTGFSVLDNGRYIKVEGDAPAFTDSESYIREIEPIMQERADLIWRKRQEILEKKKDQLSLLEMFNFISPSFQLRKVMTSLANTDYETYGSFLKETRRYRRMLIDDFANKGYFTSNVLAFFTRRPREEITSEKYQERVEYYRAELRKGTSFDKLVHQRLWGPLDRDLILPFSRPERSPGFEMSIVPTLILFVMMVATFVTGFYAFRRYDVR